ncbi:epoxyqueuosine reductase QueH, partial [Escherichia coli]|nr:epoxyqueuosine reductase QueH [Escherichia coli]HAN0256784.1 epoxyqueuosine reductase QueH [Escherichia coli]
MATDADYDTENWFERVKPERSVRCSMCFAA